MAYLQLPGAQPAVRSLDVRMELPQSPLGFVKTSCLLVPVEDAEEAKMFGAAGNTVGNYGRGGGPANTNIKQVGGTGFVLGRAVGTSHATSSSTSSSSSTSRAHQLQAPSSGTTSAAATTGASKQSTTSTSTSRGGGGASNTASEKLQQNQKKMLVISDWRANALQLPRAPLLQSCEASSGFLSYPGGRFFMNYNLGGGGAIIIKAK